MELGAGPAQHGDGTKLNWVALSREFTVLKSAPATAWLGDLPREPFNQVLRDQERAFTAFFAKRAKYPRFRRCGVPYGIRFTLDQRREQVERGEEVAHWARVSLPGLGALKLRRSENLLGRLRSITLHREGRAWYGFSGHAIRAIVSRPERRGLSRTGSKCAYRQPGSSPIR